MHGRSLFEFYWRTRCHVDVGEWRRRCRRGVPFSFYRIGDETTLLPFSRGDTSVRPISLLFLRRSGLLAPGPPVPPPPFYLFIPLSPSLSLSIFYSLSWGASNIFLSSQSRPWINYSPTLNIWAFCAGMGPPSRDRPQKGREWVISIDRHRSWGKGMSYLEVWSFNFWKMVIFKRRKGKNRLFASIQ